MRFVRERLLLRCRASSIPMQLKYDAIIAVQLGNLTKTAIATKYDVSASTLFSWLSKKDYIKSCERTKKELLRSVMLILIDPILTDNLIFSNISITERFI